MAKYTTENIHAVALVGHGGAGKTTLAEALLWKAGVIGAMGSTERGNTVGDSDPLEKQYGHSLASALVNFPYKGIHVHLVDTPGMPDFAGQSIAALAAVDLAVIVINAQNGIELNTSRMMRSAARRGLDRMILVNKIDAENVDPKGSSSASRTCSARSACRSTSPRTATRTWWTASSIPTATRISPR